MAVASGDPEVLDFVLEHRKLEDFTSHTWKHCFRFGDKLLLQKLIHYQYQQQQYLLQQQPPLHPQETQALIVRAASPPPSSSAATTTQLTTTISLCFIVVSHKQLTFQLGIGTVFSQLTLTKLVVAKLTNFLTLTHFLTAFQFHSKQHRRYNQHINNQQQQQ
ncbi:hypothetical protein PPL_09816 [Heterostelium album PN500]|uniref:Uncharacterized protein n=1 Tax=Heterostelium pallidum (strain ATCC 26659 / Pp 5 / PN500) TaxID=670386 RepID=D3BP53_HETP5|nr:hypothetical protein PPL_09816 [Heterostelium album PN500]EFA77063.1 hypothetical protein PPL_09816 [Heterostelium album PN500]|eukprot:XP_020429192.1 hypothetical protein PPL_09816 [Heterostelium album PN500]